MTAFARAFAVVAGHDGGSFVGDDAVVEPDDDMVPCVCCVPCTIHHHSGFESSSAPLATASRKTWRSATGIEASA